MALDDFTGQNIQDTYQRVVQTENGVFADGTGSAINIITPNQTASFVTNSDTASFVITNSDVLFSNITASANISASGTGSFNHLEISATANIAGVLSIPGIQNVSASVAAAIAGGDDLGNHTATQALNLNSNKIIGATSISASGDISASNLSGINTGDQDLSTYIQNSDTASFVTNSQTASFLVPSDTASFLVPSDTASFLVPADTASFLVPSDTASFLVPSDTASFLVPADTASFLVPSDTASFALTSNVVSNSSTSSFAILNQNATFNNITALGDIIAENYIVSSSVTHMTQSFSSGSTIFGDTITDTHQFSGSVFISGSSLQINGANVLTASPFTPTSISESLGTNANLIRSLTATSISESLGTNANLIRSLTATSISESLGTNATLIRSLTAASISESFNQPSSSFSTRVTTLEGNGVFTPTSISESLGTNATLIRSLTATSISESLGTNATLIRSLTATSISESLGTNANLIRSLTATSISESFVAPSSSFSTRVTNLEDTTADRTFGQITASGDISASGLLYISASETSATNYKILVQNSADGRIYTTGSVAGGGISSFTNIASDVTPDGDATRDLGSPTAKWEALYAQDTFFGGIHEINLETIGISQLQTGTVLVSKAGQMVPCDTKGDALVMGVVTSGSDYPVIMGAEPVLVDGAVYEGDYIITSNRLGYGKAVPPDQIFEQRLFGKIIAQSLETNINGGVIKAMIRKM